MNTITVTGRLLKMPEIKVHEKDGHKTYIAKYILVSRKPFATKGNSINYIYCDPKHRSQTSCFQHTNRHHFPIHWINC